MHYLRYYTEFEYFCISSSDLPDNCSVIPLAVTAFTTKFSQLVFIFEA